MKSTDVFPSKYLRADDLKGGTPVVTIRGVTVETLGDDSKPVLHFQGKDKGLVMNKTNWTAVAEIAGDDDSENWAGVKVKLYATKVDFQGKRVLAIRIDQPSGMAPKPEPINPPSDDDIPF